MKTHFIRNSLIFALSVFLLLLISCLEDTWIIDKSSTRQTALSIREAQKYFNENVTEFHFSPPVSGRAADEEAIAIPLWEQGKKITLKKKEVIEVPLEAPVTVVSRYNPSVEKKEKKRKYANTIYRLIADKQDDGSYIYTTARITLDDECMHERKKSRKHLTMSLDNLKGFSGGIRYYSISGEFLTGNIYIDGVKRYVISSSEKQDTVSSRSTVISRSHTECEEHVYQVEHYSCTDVYVEGVLMNSSCVLTDITYETEYVCVEVPDEDDSDNNDDTGSSEGNDGISGSEDGDEKGSNTPKTTINLMLSTKFVPYNTTDECWDLCVKVLENYGQNNPGSRMNVHQLKIETNMTDDRLDYWSKNPTISYQNAVTCIDRHLENGKVIIVGVDYKLGSPNIDGTDHYVVITGRGYDDEGKLYYNFMDCATYSATKGCSSENKLYYMENNGFPIWSGNTQCDYNTEFDELTVMHVRPNDGNTENTIELQGNVEQ